MNWPRSAVGNTKTRPTGNGNRFFCVGARSSMNDAMLEGDRERRRAFDNFITSSGEI